MTIPKMSSSPMAQPSGQDATNSSIDSLIDADEDYCIYRTWFDPENGSQSGHEFQLIKTLKHPEDEASQQRLRREYVLTRSLRLPILFEPFEFTSEPCWQFKLVDEGWRPLPRGLAASGPAGVTPARFFSIAIALVEALQALHDQRLSHGDLSLHCVWVHPQQPGIKLSNLGNAQLLPPGQTHAVAYQRDVETLCKILQQLKPELESIDFEGLFESIKIKGGTASLNLLRQTLHLAAGLEITLSRAVPRQLPEKIYGRDAEIAALLAAYQRVASHRNAELILLAGASGLGKTAVVEAVEQRLRLECRPGIPLARFIRCKFEQFNHRIPLGAIIQGMRQGLGELGFEEALASVDGQGDWLRPMPKGRPTTESVQADRLNLLAQWILSLPTPDHPLVLCLDDLHWADPASLVLLEKILSVGAEAPLLVVGIYREREVGPQHLLQQTLNRLQGIGYQTLTLSPLTLDCFSRWLEEILGQNAVAIAPLAHLLERQSQGNPFFGRQLLLSLHRQGQLVYDASESRWCYDAIAIEAQLPEEALIEFLARQLATLPETTQLALQLAACLGNQFQLAALARIYPGSDTRHPPDPPIASITLEIELWPAIQQEFLQQIGPDRYRFVHDRIQQAACLLLPGSAQDRWAIAQTLLSSLPWAGRDSQIFETIDQLDPAWHLVQNSNRRAQLTQLHLVAGRRALVNQDYAATIRYFTRGLEWLPGNAWEDHYELTLDLHEAASAAEYRHTNFYRAASLADTILEKAQDLHDQAKAYEIRIRLYVAAAQHDQALDLGLDFLRQLDTPLEVGAIAEKGRFWGGNLQSTMAQSIDDLAKLPIMTSRRHLLMMRLLAQLVLPCLDARPHLLPNLVSTMLRLTHDRGLSHDAAVAYSALAVIHQDPMVAQQAMWILHQLNVQERRGQVLLLIDTRVYGWHVPLVEVQESLAQTVQLSLARGELEIAAQAALQYCSHRFLSGAPLPDVAEDCIRYQEMVETLQQALPSVLNQALQRLIASLRGQRASENEKTSGIHPRPWWELPAGSTGSTPLTLPALTFLESFSQGVLLFFGGHPRPALAAFSWALRHRNSVTGLLIQATCRFYAALCLLSLCDGAPATQRQALLATVTQIQARFRTWSHQAPANFEPYRVLIEAERSRVLGHWEAAHGDYDRAIALAHSQNHGPVIALAHELAARSYRQQNKSQLAAAALKQAHRAHQNWGALAKAEALAADYPEIFWPPSTLATHPDSTRATHRPQREAIALNASQEAGLSSLLRACQRLIPLTTDWGALTIAILQGVAELAPMDRMLLLTQDCSAESEPAQNFGQNQASRPSETSGPAAALQWRVQIKGQRQSKQSLWVKCSLRNDPRPAKTLAQLPPIFAAAFRQGIAMSSPSHASQSNPSPHLFCLRLGLASSPVALLYGESAVALSASQQQQLELLGQQSAVALSHARTQAALVETLEQHTEAIHQEITERQITEQQLAQQLERAQLVETVTQEIRASLHPEGLLQATAAAIGSAFQCSRCVLHRYPAGEAAPWPLVAEYLAPGCTSLQANPLAIEHNPYVPATLDQEGVVAMSNIYSHAMENPARVFCLHTQTKSLLAIKTCYQGNVNGILALHQCDRFRQWLPDEMALFQILADQVGIAHAQVQQLEAQQQQRQALETAKAKIEKTCKAKGEFIASLGHELRTPLNAILGFSQLMAQDTATASRHLPMLRTINESGEHLVRLIDDVMAMAKLEAGRATLAVESVDLAEMLRSLRDVFFLQTKIKGLSLTIDRDDSVPSHIRTDAGKLRQILVNLVGNAVKFTEEGSVNIRVRSEAQRPEQTGKAWKFLWFEIEDTGPGIPLEEVGSLFQDFEQTQLGRCAEGGTGLGLSISRKLVELMGGEISVESDPQRRRTVFRFYILVEHLAQPQSSPQQSQLPRLTVDSLSVMGSDWVERLEQATTLLDQEAIFQLLDEVPKTYSRLRDAIAQITHQFGYETLIELTQAYLANHIA